MNIPEQDGLIDAARAARESAYAPFSNFKVGAAVLVSSGRVFTGCNVENASFGLTVCAERVAIWKAVSEGEREIVAVAISVDGKPAMPCGACLQVMQEFAGDSSPVVIAAGSDGEVIRYTLAELMPHAFEEFQQEGK